MEQETSFGALLRRFRKAYKYYCTQAEIAELFEYSEETIRSWELSRRFPASDEIPRLARLMGLDVDEIRQAIQVGHAQAQPGKIVLGNNLHFSTEITLSSFLINSVFNSDRLTFLENEIFTRWEAYRTGGSLLASRGLASWVDAIEAVVQETKESKGQARATSVLNATYQLGGSICSDLMLYGQAHASYKKALCIAKDQQDNELMAAALARRGVAYIQQEKPMRAISYLDHAAMLVQDLPVIHLKGYLFKALAEAHAMTHHLDESIRYIDTAEDILEQLSGGPERSYCQVNITSVLAQKGVNAVVLQQYHNAIILIDQSLKHYHPAYIRGRARLIAQKAEAFYGLKQIEECIEVAEEAFTLANAVGSRKTIERLQKLHLTLVKSRWRKEVGVERLGALLAVK